MRCNELQFVTMSNKSCLSLTIPYIHLHLHNPASKFTRCFHEIHETHDSLHLLKSEKSKICWEKLYTMLINSVNTNDANTDEYLTSVNSHSVNSSSFMSLGYLPDQTIPDTTQNNQCMESDSVVVHTTTTTLK